MPKPEKSPLTAKSSGNVLHRALAEWLRDTDEIDELLAQSGVTASDNPQRNRAQLLAVLQAEDLEVVASLLHGLASGFALMLEDIVNACERWGVSIGGEVLLPGGRPLGRSSALDTSWAHATDGNAILQGASSARVITEQLRSARSGLAGASLIHKSREKVLNQTGRIFADHPDPRFGLVVGMGTSSTHRYEERTTASVQDRQSLASCTQLLRQMRGAAAPLRDGSLDTILRQLDVDVRGRLNELQGVGLTNQPASPGVQQLLQQLSEIAPRLPSVARAKVRAKRAARGLGTFVQSELWASRWRLYEVWVLIRCLQTLERAGLVLDLLDVRDDVWHLRYGQSTEPIARARSVRSALELEVYYQLFVRGKSDFAAPDPAMPSTPVAPEKPTSAMPDIAVRHPDGPYVFVVDPKHGPSHRLSSVRGVLDRYAERFKAAVTAVVNYTEMPRYRFENMRAPEHAGGGHAILASGMAPGSITARRLELCLEEAVLSQLTSKERLVDRSAPTPLRTTRRTSSLLYWAASANEVDEPAGAWMLGRAGELQHLPKLSELAGQYKDVHAFSANPGGTACLVATDRSLVFLWDGNAKRVEHGASFGSIRTTWCRCGRHVAVASFDRTWVYDALGSRTADLPHISDKSAIAWSADCNVIYTIDGSWSVQMMRLDAIEAGWKRYKQPGSSYGDPRVVFDSRRSRYCVEGHGHGPTDHGLVAYLVEGDTPMLEPAADQTSALWACSPVDDRSVVRGPASLRYPTTLFKVINSPGDIQVGPLIRTPNPPDGEVLWSLEGDRFAFLAKRQLYVCVPGEKYGMPVAMPGQRPCGLAWLDARLLARWT